MAKIAAIKSGKKTGGIEVYPLAFGLFLGLALLKFGNPVILDSKISAPDSLNAYLNDPWPTHWAVWGLLPLVLAGAALVCSKKWLWPVSKWLWLPPLLWFGWQLVSAGRTVDASLTATTLGQFFGCIACYFLGTSVLNSDQRLRWLMVGVLAAFTFCLVRAVDQRVFEFPQNHQMLVEGERIGWTNLPPETVLEMKHEGIIVHTNDLDLANPVILAKFAKGRVNGTLVYPNALAGAVLLLFPVSLVFAFGSTNRLRPMIRVMVIALTLFLGIAGFFWTGSKLGWLVAMVVGEIYLLRLNWPGRLKWTVLTLILLVGLGIFGIRFHHYFAAGATSAGARFDYWRAAVQTTLEHPLLGTGPGTFQRPYAELKAPDEEMARLAHNDYLEQFSDSGIPGGIFYAVWILAAFTFVARKSWKTDRPLDFAVFAGLLGWFIQGVGEFGLYIPALAWTAFTLLGISVSLPGNRMDNARPAN